MSSTRLRDLSIRIGEYPPGPLNAITDVPGVLVGQATLLSESPCIARTGVTAVFPRADIHRDAVFAAVHNFNGIGEMTGLPFMEETGLLTSPVMLTGTHSVGLVYDTMVRYGLRKYGGFSYALPVVAETHDGWLNDVSAFPLAEAHVIEALETASGGPVAEGNTGGGTGMICYEFKGGTGTASRQVETARQKYTIGALVQTNHGNRNHLLVDGAPVGQALSAEVVPLPWPTPPPSSSIIVVIATDAPLLPNQCHRLAKRATIGLARTGGFGLDLSGDIFLAFSTGVHSEAGTAGLNEVQYLSHFSMDPLVIGCAEAVEEAILNSIVAAETLKGYAGRTAFALPHDLLLEALRRARAGE